MLHIRQKNSSLDEDKAYTVVLPIEDLPIEQHPCLINYPNRFELVNNDIPEDAQYLKYQ